MNEIYLQRLKEDLRLKNYAKNTREDYYRFVVRFLDFTRKDAMAVTYADIRKFVFHMMDNELESLARANIICTDKTGTITTGELRVNEVLPMGRVTRDQVMDIMAHINSAFTDTNVTQDALNAAFGKTKGWAARGIIPFSSERKFRAVSFDGHGDSPKCWHIGSVRSSLYLWYLITSASA